MKIADNFANYGDDNFEEYDYFDEEYEEFDDGYSKAKDEVQDEIKPESKVPMDKFGWFYKACVITCYLSLLTNIISLIA